MAEQECYDTDNYILFHLSVQDVTQITNHFTLNASSHISVVKFETLYPP
jgi:hypothetical protein